MLKWRQDYGKIKLENKDREEDKMNTERINVVVSPELKEEIATIATQMNISINSLIRMAVTEWIKNHK